MNTYATVGKNALKLLFSKMNVFREPKIDGNKIIYSALPDDRELMVSNDSVDIEKGGYKSHSSITRGNTKRENMCKIFTWGVVTGLIEIPLEMYKTQDTLMHMICDTHIKLKLPTHIVIASNRKAFTYADTNNVGAILSESESETITIYALDNTQKVLISDSVMSTELRKYLNKSSEGTLNSPIE